MAKRAMIDETDRLPRPERMMDAVTHVAGYTLVAGLGAMAYGAALYCWIAERIEARRPSP
jgi:hypothetical protein